MTASASRSFLESGKISHEPAVERFDGVAPNRLDKDNWTGYQNKAEQLAPF